MDAVVEACRVRLRPILMTSFAFILGVVPLELAKGAGAELHIPLGVAVVAGMLGVTYFGLVLTPVFYLTIMWFGGTKKPAPLCCMVHRIRPSDGRNKRRLAALSETAYFHIASCISLLASLSPNKGSPSVTSRSAAFEILVFSIFR